MRSARRTTAPPRPCSTFTEESDLDGLIAKVMTAWAKLGAGDKDGAMATLDELAGPDWYGLFVSYSKGLIAEEAGLNDEADAAYQAAIDDVAAGGAAPDAWLRAAEAYAGFLARQGKKDAALAVLEKADEFSSGRLPLLDLRDKIIKGEAGRPHRRPPRRRARASFCWCSPARSTAAAANPSCGSICNMRWR